MSLDKMQFTEVGNYEILQHIKPERLSKTFKVKHKYTEEVFALKVVFAEDPAVVQTLERTFKRLNKGLHQLDNQNLIRFKEYFIEEIDGNKCFVKVDEFFFGKELESFLKSDRILTKDEKLDIFSKICSGIKDAHNTTFQDDHGVEVEGFPHGAITPWNIMINDDLELRLLDFKLTDRYTISETNQKKTISGSISKSSDITQLGYFLNFLFSKDKDAYSTWNLEEKTLQEIAAGIEGIDSKKEINKIAHLIYKSTRKNEEKYSSVEGLIRQLNGESELPIGRKMNPRKKYLIGITAMVLMATLNFFLFKNYTATQKAASLSEAQHRGVSPKSETSANGSPIIGEYYAYMIGNENYKNLKSLSKPIQDVNTFKDILTNSYSFKPENIITKYNASRDDIYDGFEQIVSKVKKNDNLLIFYAGHGQIHDETGYWIPVEGLENSRRNWMSNNEIKDFLNSIVARNILIVSDACFGGSLLRDINSPKTGGRISNKKTRIALTSGSLETVPDKSVFIDQLFWYLQNNQDSLVYTANIFAGIREGVVANTKTDPGYGPIRDAGHQGGDFFFIKSGETGSAGEPAQTIQ